MAATPAAAPPPPPPPEGKKGAPAAPAPPGGVTLLPGFVDGQERRLPPAHLSGADPEGGFVLHEDDGVGFDRADGGPGEAQIVPLRIGGAAGRGHLPLGLVRDVAITETVLHQESAPHPFVVERRLVVGSG